jgi:hypothetical protein
MTGPIGRVRRESPKIDVGLAPQHIRHLNVGAASTWILPCKHASGILFV